MRIECDTRNRLAATAILIAESECERNILDSLYTTIGSEGIVKIKREDVGPGDRPGVLVLTREKDPQDW